MRKALIRAVKILGGQSQTGRLLGLRQQSIFHWIKVAGRPPANHVLALEKLTNGQVTRHQLRPDLYPLEMPHVDQRNSESENRE